MTKESDLCHASTKRSLGFSRCRAYCHVMQDKNKTSKGSGEEQSRQRLPRVSAKLPDGTVLELLYRAEEHRTLFAVARDGVVSEAEKVELPSGKLFVPYSPENNLITHRAILLPSEATEYGSEPELRARVQDFIHRYVDLSPDFEEVAGHYVFLSWMYDAFEDLPYLRVLGDYGSGKSRFLKAVGSISYRPIFASGASSVSPLFRILDSAGGTLVLDEGDFRFSDEKSEMVKILNNGSSTGFPVLRTETTPAGEFNPRAFSVYGPKLIATRQHFEDPALESRCITAIMGTREVRSDIPSNLGRDFEDEALSIRNQLLMYRLRTTSRPSVLDPAALRLLEPPDRSSLFVALGFGGGARGEIPPPCLRPAVEHCPSCTPERLNRSGRSSRSARSTGADAGSYSRQDDCSGSLPRRDRCIAFAPGGRGDSSPSRPVPPQAPRKLRLTRRGVL